MVSQATISILYVPHSGVKSCMDQICSYVFCRGRSCLDWFPRQYGEVIDGPAAAGYLSISDSSPRRLLRLRLCVGYEFEKQGVQVLSVGTKWLEEAIVNAFDDRQGLIHAFDAFVGEAH